MHAIILSIGDELTLGQTVDTNSAWLSSRLAAHGIPTDAHQTVPDDRRAIELAIRWAAHHAELLIVSGGLGPTDDDLTRFALAEAMGVQLTEDPAALNDLAAFFADRGRPMPERNRVQALLPTGSTFLPNPHGTAPGIRATVDRATVFVVPGVPREMQPMFADHILPVIADRPGVGRTILTRKINTFGAGESTIAEQLADLMARDRIPLVGTTVSGGVVSVRIRSEADDPALAAGRLEDTTAIIEQRLGPLVYGRDDDTLAAALIDLLRREHRTVATAESCTGGMIGVMLTDTPGASAVYVGGWITYTNALKRDQLGIPDSLLATCGAVSEPVVTAMARGTLDRSGADLAIAASGIAGPDGGTADKPVGTVWFALARRHEDGTITTNARLARFPGSRATIRDRAAKTALQWLRLTAAGNPTDHLTWLIHPEPTATGP